MPLLMLGYFCAYLDRSNVGMAATTMVQYLGFTNAVFGFGAGLFFLGYFLGEIPSNLILNRVGARRWIARILITWGIIAALTGFVWNELSFYGIRFLLGLAEAGFYPGVLLYLTWWFPSYYRSRMMGIFQSASVISLFVGPPIGGLLLHMQGLLGLQGWQWLYIMEGLPPIIMCFVTWKLLTDRPHDAAWLTSEQRTWLQDRVDSEQAQREAVRKYSLGQAFGNPKMLLLTIAYVGQNGSAYGLVFFLPLIVKGLGVSTDWIGLVSALPYLCAFVAMIYWGYHSDLHGERTWHVAGSSSLLLASSSSCRNGCRRSSGQPIRLASSVAWNHLTAPPPASCTGRPTGSQISRRARADLVALRKLLALQRAARNFFPPTPPSTKPSTSNATSSRLKRTVCFALTR